jgi:hypothetical protein
VVVNLGDALASNVYDSATEAPDFSGTITGGTASGSPETLTANASGYYWLADDDHIWWRSDSAHMAWAERYNEMAYTFAYTPVLPQHDLLVDLDIDSVYGWKIEWRKALAETLWAGDSTATFWTGDDDAEFWSGDAGDWNVYTGRLKTDGQPYDIRITTPASPEQAEITEIGTRLDVDDLIEKLNDVAIADTGTRLTLSKDFLEIKNISYVFQSDGGDAVRIEIADYSTSGPLIYARDASQSLTTATLDVSVQGLANRGG